MRFKLNFLILRFWMLIHLLEKHHSHHTFHTHKTTPCEESYERMHLSQPSMPHDLHVCLKKPSTHSLLHPWSFFLMYKEHHEIPSLSQHFWIYIASYSAIILHISNTPLQISGRFRSSLKFKISHLRT